MTEREIEMSFSELAWPPMYAHSRPNLDLIEMNDHSEHTSRRNQ